MTEQPPPLNYHSSGSSSEPVVRPFQKFLMGVVLGICAVLVGFWLSQVSNNIVPTLIAAGLEFMTGIVVVACSRRLRHVGIGLICAVPLALMLFFVGCAILISMK